MAYLSNKVTNFYSLYQDYFLMDESNHIFFKDQRKIIEVMKFVEANENSKNVVYNRLQYCKFKLKNF